MNKWEEKYKGIEDIDFDDKRYKEESASAIYYGDIMSSLLSEMQNGINKAVEIYNKIKSNYEEPYVRIFINEDTFKMSFSISNANDENYDDADEEDPEEFLVYNVGEIMDEALYLMNIMDESGLSTPISQAVNNWVEDLGWDGFGEFDADYGYSDSWDHIDY